MSQDPILITGATAGLGLRLAERLADAGVSMLLGGRRPQTLNDLCRTLADRAESGSPSPQGFSARPFLADLSDLDQVRSALDRLLDDEKLRLSGVVTNAGLTTTRNTTTAQGFELTFGVNVLAHQLLLRRLADRLTEGARVVIVSSGVHEPDNRLARMLGVPAPRWVGTDALARPDQAPAELRLKRGPLRYSTSKLGNVLQARGLQHFLREAGRQVDVFAIDPGLMVDTDLARELPAPLRPIFRAIGRWFTPRVDNMRLSTTSARHIESLLRDPIWSQRGFLYLDGDQPKPPSADAQRNELMRELWIRSSDLVGLAPG